MKRISTYLALVLSFLLMNISSAQTSKYEWLPQDSWSFGFGVLYPRYISTNLNWVEGPQNFGAFVSLQRNFSEHVGLRLALNYIKLGAWDGGRNISPYITNKIFGSNFDLIYYLAPVEPISPYLGIGLGGFTHSIDGSPRANLNTSQLDYQFNLTFGSEWTVSPDWKIKTELQYHTAASSAFDGEYGTVNGGSLGGYDDSYMTFQIGAVYYFKKGEPSHLNDLYTGIKTNVDYDKIESIVKRYATEPTVIDYNKIEDIVKKYANTQKGVSDNWVLIGVNFDFDKATLREESYPILYHAVEILLTHPNVTVEIQGYTDNVGTEAYNQKLSERRAETVKTFLVAKGVASNRITTVGFGETKPAVDNNTSVNRALNRRIEFKVTNK